MNPRSKPDPWAEFCRRLLAARDAARPPRTLADLSARTP